MTDVINIHGKKEPYDEQKLKTSIENAINEAGEDLDKRKPLINNIMDEIDNFTQNKEVIKAEDLRHIILDNFEKEWVGDQVPMARVWRNYELKHKIIYREKLD
ncbi:MAG: ATP cone domain-containing protein [Methanobacterium sp.]